MNDTIGLWIVLTLAGISGVFLLFLFISILVILIKTPTKPVPSNVNAETADIVATIIGTHGG